MDFQRGRIGKTLKGHSDMIFEVKVSGNFIISAGNDKTVKNMGYSKWKLY